MMPKMWIVAAGVFLGAICAAPSQAAVAVLGGGVARECYLAVKGRDVPILGAIQVCDLALEQENLSLRNRAATFVNRGILKMRQGRNDSAIADFERGIRMQPKLYEAYVNRGAALYALRRYDEALADFNLGVQSEDLDAKVTGFYNRGLTYEKKGDATAAYNDYRKALELAPDFALATKQLARFSVEPAP